MSCRAAAAALALAGALGLLACGRQAPRPPIVLISIDTLRADRLPDWGYAGGSTPHLSALARDAILFESAWAQVPLTLPSHASLLTGRLPPEVGVRSNIGFHFDAAAHPTLPARLAAEAGYATAAAVSAYVLRKETGLGAAFEHYDDAMEVHESSTLGALQRPGAETVDAALGWLAGVANRPWFLFLHLFEPHTPYEPPSPFRERLADPYDGEIAAADAAVGRLLDALRARGDYDRALIVVLSDHGEGLGDHGEKEHGILLYREALHVPLLVKLPGGERGGTRVAAPAALFDVVPTVTDLLGLARSPGLAGVSLLELADGEAAERRIYSETLYPRLHLGWSELRSLVDARWHAIEGPDPELYDWVADPAQRTNLRARERRVWAERAAELAAIPLAFEPPAPASAEELARLAALGYLGAPAVSGAGPLPDPKSQIPLLAEIQRSFELVHQGRLEEALELCVRLLGEHPDLIDLRNQLAATLRRLGRFEEALAVYAETERRYPSLGPSLAIERAKIELDLDWLDDAAASAARAQAENPLEAELILATVAGRRGDWATAERRARAGIGDPRRPRVPALLLLAQALLAQERLPEALAEIERAVAETRRPGAKPVVTVESTYGDLLARLGRNAEAEAAFRREIALFPQGPEAYARLAILLAAERRFAEIEPTLDALAAANPSPRALAVAAETMERLGNDEGAAAYRARARAAAGAAQRAPRGAG